MRILDRYIVRSFLLAFAVTLLVLTFVMCLGLIFRVTSLLAKGVSWRLLLEIFAYGVPTALSFGTPVSLLTASLLVFGRMSADSEIVAMKSGGLSVWQIMAKPMAVALLLTLACLYVNWEVAPWGRYAQRVAIKTLGTESLLDLLDEGRFVQDIEGMKIYVGRKEGDRIRDIIIYDSRSAGARREIRAKWGTAQISADHKDFVVDLHEVRVDPFYEDRPGAGYCQSLPIHLPLDMDGLRRVSRRDGDLTSGEILARVQNPGVFYPDTAPQDMAAQRMSLLVEYNKRMTMAASCLAFVFLGAPLGIRTQRKESSIGLAISLVVVLTFYVFMIIADTLSKRPELYPHLFLWFPIACSAVLGLYLVRRSS